MSEIIIIGQNYNTSLGLIKSVGEGGFKCATVKFNRKKSFIRNLLRIPISPDLCSKYVDRWVIIPREPEMTLVNGLISNFGDKTNKKVVLPADDYCAFVLDRNYHLLSELFHVPHIINITLSLEYYMDKQNQKIIAEKYDINISKTWSVNIKKGNRVSIPKGVIYPCITKPQSSIGLPKSYIQKCNNKDELQSLLNHFANETSCEILIEEYIEVEEEFTIPGISDGTNVIIPSFLKKRVIGKGAHKGVTICGRVMNAELYESECSKLKSMMRIIGFSGIFDIEILKSNGKFYLNEINFRNGAAGFSLTKAGINLPAIYVNYILNKIPLALSNFRLQELTFLNDKAALEHYIAGECTLTEYKSLKKNVDVSLIDNKDDRFAQLSFRFLGLKLLISKYLRK